MRGAYASSTRAKRLILFAAAAFIAGTGGALTHWRDDHALLINASGSLPNWAFFLDRTRLPRRGDFIFFTPPPSPLLVRHFGDDLKPFGKIVYGVAGDRVTQKDRTFFVNGRAVAHAKLKSRLGEPLALGPTGTIPTGCYFVGTPHPDSFDSRYAAIGWICRSRILGVGRAIL